MSVCVHVHSSTHLPTCSKYRYAPAEGLAYIYYPSPVHRSALRFGYGCRMYRYALRYLQYINSAGTIEIIIDDIIVFRFTGNKNSRGAPEAAGVPESTRSAVYTVDGRRSTAAALPVYYVKPNWTVNIWHIPTTTFRRTRYLTRTCAFL